jgi:hypothetical protein
VKLIVTSLEARNGQVRSADFWVAPIGRRAVSVTARSHQDEELTFIDYSDDPLRVGDVLNVEVTRADRDEVPNDGGSA